MKISKWFSLKRLIPFSLLVSPVVGEMVINYSGLPTPWTVALISAGLAFGSIMIGQFVANKNTTEENHQSDQLKIGLLSMASSTFTATRCSFALFGSWLSFGIYGLSGFQYAELSWLASLATVVYFLSFEKTLKKAAVNMWKGVWELSKKALTNLSNSCAEESRARSDRQAPFSIFLAIIIFSFLSTIIGIATFISILLTFNIISPPISYLWNIVSLAMYADRFNFAKSAQFITTCSEIPSSTWHTIVQCSQDNTCLLGSRDIRIIDIFIRVLGIIFPFWCLVPILEAWKGEKFWNREQNRESEKKPWKEVIKEISNKSSLIILIVTLFYLVAMASIQAKGLDTTGLESCDINPSLLSSKTGYISEWFSQEWTALKQLAMV